MSLDKMYLGGNGRGNKPQERFTDATPCPIPALIRHDGCQIKYTEAEHMCTYLDVCMSLTSACVLESSSSVTMVVVCTT